MTGTFIHVCVLDDPKPGSNIVPLLYTHDFASPADAAMAIRELKRDLPNRRIIVRLMDEKGIIPMAVLN